LSAGPLGAKLEQDQFITRFCAGKGNATTGGDFLVDNLRIEDILVCTNSFAFSFQCIQMVVSGVY